MRLGTCGGREQRRLKVARQLHDTRKRRLQEQDGRLRI
jgi:hypothetical protein